MFMTFRYSPSCFFHDSLWYNNHFNNAAHHPTCPSLQGALLLIKRENLEPDQGSIHRISAKQEKTVGKRTRDMEETWWHGQGVRDGQR